MRGPAPWPQPGLVLEGGAALLRSIRDGLSFLPDELPAERAALPRLRNTVERGAPSVQWERPAVILLPYVERRIVGRRSERAAATGGGAARALPRRARPRCGGIWPRRHDEGQDYIYNDFAGQGPQGGSFQRPPQSYLQMVGNWDSAAAQTLLPQLRCRCQVTQHQQEARRQELEAMCCP